MKKEILNSLWKIGVIITAIGLLISFIYYSHIENMFKMIESGIILIILFIIYGVEEVTDELRKKELTAEDIERITKEEIEKIMEVKK